MSISDLVPLPLRITVLEGTGIRGANHLQLVSGLGSVPERVQPALEDAASQLGLTLREGTGHWSISLSQEEGHATEWYRLHVQEDAIEIAASADEGFFRAFSTLVQLGDVTADGAHFPAVLIEDEPRYPWRGLSLDVARSFYPVPEVLEVIDLLVRYRMNVLHLHLTDDQGWRLEIPNRPLLTEVSGKTAVDGGRAGHYSLRDLAQIISYADKWGVTVVPEIDVPGHTNAATHAYAGMSRTGELTDSYTGIEVGRSGIYPSPETAAFLADVFEVATAIPGPFVHLGGDEADEVARADYDSLVRSAAQIIRESGKTAVAWQEAATAGLPAGSIIQYWDPRQELTPIVQAAGSGISVLMSPANRAYLDMKYDESTAAGQDWAGYISLENAYDWDPEDEMVGLLPGSIVGVEACIWTERIHSFEELTSMLLPRLAALAEVAWTAQSKRHLGQFAHRLSSESKWWESKEIGWFQHPGVDWNRK